MPRVRLSTCVIAVVVVVAVGCGDDSDIISGTEPSTTTPAAASPTTETHPPVARSVPVPELPRVDIGSTGPHPELFFLFPAESDAREAAAELDDAGYLVRTTPPADDIPEWSVIAEGTPSAPSLKAAERTFRQWARAHNGKYDGNEIPVGP